MGFITPTLLLAYSAISTPSPRPAAEQIIQLRNVLKSRIGTRKGRERVIHVKVPIYRKKHHLRRICSIFLRPVPEGKPTNAQG